MKIGIPKRFIEHSVLGKVFGRLGLLPKQAGALSEVAACGHIAFFLRPRDIVDLVRDGCIDVGLVYSEWLPKPALDTLILGSLESYKAQLAILASSHNEPFLSLESFLQGTGLQCPTIVTEFQGFAEGVLRNRLSDFKLLTTHGSTEGLVPHIADLAIECIETGRSALVNGLYILEVVKESRVHIIVNSRSYSRLQDSVDSFQRELLRLELEEKASAMGGSQWIDLEKCSPESRYMIHRLHEEHGNRHDIFQFDSFTSKRPVLRHIALRQGTVSLSSFESTLKQCFERDFAHKDEEDPKDCLLLMLYVFDKVTRELFSSSSHLYVEGDEEVLNLYRCSGRLHFDPSATRGVLLLLRDLGLIYRFDVACSLLSSLELSAQIRLCGWGRKYVESFLLNGLVRVPWAEIAERMKSQLVSILSPYSEDYMEYLRMLRGGGSQLQRCYTLRERLPLRIVI